MAKKPTGGLTRGEKKKIKSKNGQKSILDDLPGVKRRKIQEKLAKYPTGGLSREEKKQIKSKNGKKTYWRTYQGEKKTIKSKNGQKHLQEDL